jgi:peptidoglycan/LPS O-acetylase OafA/YrhL
MIRNLGICATTPFLSRSLTPSAAIQVATPRVLPAAPKSVGSCVARTDQIPTLDGWRALAVLGVIAYHSLANGLRPGWIGYGLAVRGYAGVNVFFALSGFLICGKLLREQQQSAGISLKRFYLVRSFRILPALSLYLAALAALAAVGWVQASGWEFMSTLVFIRNYFPLFYGHPIGTYTAQFWSLAVEEHFYLIWPLVMVVLGPKLRRIGLAALALALIVFAWRSLDAHFGWFIPFATSVDSKTDTRMDALLWGCLAAIVYPYVHPRVQALPFGRSLWVPIAAVLAVVLILKHVPGGSLIQAILFPALIMSTAISPDSVLGRCLELRILKWTGRLSYSIYIWQQLLIIPVDSPSSPFRALQHFPANIAFVFLIAAASYYFVEKPMIQLGHRLGAPAGKPLAARASRERMLSGCGPSRFDAGEAA